MMSDLKTLRKEMNNRMKLLEKDDQHFINGIIRYLVKYDFTDNEILSIKDELINKSIESRDNFSDITQTIINPKEYCNKLIIKDNRRKVSLFSQFTLVLGGLTLLLFLVTLLFDGETFRINGGSGNMVYTILKYSYIRYIIGFVFIMLSTYFVDRKFDFNQGAYTFVSTIRILIMVLLMDKRFYTSIDVEWIRIDTKIIMGLIVLVSIITLILYIKQIELKKQP